MSHSQHFEARFCGVGGQGIILSSTILADAAIFYAGKYAVQSPTYGSQVRGGPTKVDLIVDDKEILYPKATNINFYLAIAQVSFTKYFHDIAEDCTILVDENLVGDIPAAFLKGTRRSLYKIPVLEMAKQEFNNLMLANMICLGVTLEVTQIVTQEHLLESVKKLVPKKHYDKNVAALQMGMDLAKNRQREEMTV